jgi:hypothetical protein
MAKAWPSAGLFRICDMLFTKRSQNGAQIERTKGFDPVQKARATERAFCCLLRFSSHKGGVSKLNKVRSPSPLRKTGYPA